MFTYTFLQHYWWFLIALLGGLLVFLLFVQGANSLIFSLTDDEKERELIINSTGRKWEFTFTTLVTFGGAFFASFPLFYSTSFGGAYWVWMLILLSFVLQAVAYEYQSKPGNLLGQRTFRTFLVLNGILGPLLLGMAVATFFTGSPFLIEKEAMGGSSLSPVISRWATSWHGLDALFNPLNYLLGFAVVFLARTNGILYMINNIEDHSLHPKLLRALRVNALRFVLFFVAFLVVVMSIDGYAVAANGEVSLESYKYLHNLIEMPATLTMLLVGVVLVLWGIGSAILGHQVRRAIWFSGLGTTIAVLAMFLLVGFNNTCYYPSSYDLQSSLHLQNSCSSEFTLRTMSYVSLLIPFVLAYIAYAWHAIDKKSLTKEELKDDAHKY